MSQKQDTEKKDSILGATLNWTIDNVVYGCIPLACVCIFKFLGGANIEILKITPDCLLVGFAISISAKSYIEEFDESSISKNLRRIFGAIPFLTCIISCLLYGGLFGEYSVFNSLGEVDKLRFVLYGLGIAILLNIAVILLIQLISKKTDKC